MNISTVIERLYNSHSMIQLKSQRFTKATNLLLKCTFILFHYLKYKNNQ